MIRDHLSVHQMFSFPFVILKKSRSEFHPDSGLVLYLLLCHWNEQNRIYYKLMDCELY